MKGEYVHTTQTGEEVPLSQLTDKHLLNIIKFIERSAKNGVEKFYALDYFGSDEMFLDCNVLYGEDVLKEMHYDEYIKEAERRRLL